MRIVLRALTMMAGLVLLLGLFALALWCQVLAATPTKIAPPTDEDMAELRESMLLQSSTAIAADPELITPCATSPAPL